MRIILTVYGSALVMLMQSCTTTVQRNADTRIREVDSVIVRERIVTVPVPEYRDTLVITRRDTSQTGTIISGYSPRHQQPLVRYYPAQNSFVLNIPRDSIRVPVADTTTKQLRERIATLEQVAERKSLFAHISEKLTELLTIIVLGCLFLVLLRAALRKHYRRS
ncbi:MAG: hypothetical protein JNL32_06430 [Candidatus Kapabacteria bacterium]|nr:hypothetical protein [Candidatus Kapabacteria bacterium]